MLKRPLMAALSAAALVTALGVTPASHASQRDSQDQNSVDHVELAARMIADGHFDRAESLLQEVDPTAEQTNTKKLFTLLGVVQLKHQRYAEAAGSFERAVREGQVDPAVQLYLAQSYFGNAQYPKCLEALARAGAEAKTLSGALMKAQALWILKDQSASLAALNEGLRAFPDHPELLRLKLFHLAELHLFQEVQQLSQRYLSVIDATPDDYVAVGEALREGGQWKQAQLLLEKAHLQFPNSETVSLQLAHSYLDDSAPTAAAMIFEEASLKNSKYALESAELFKEARRLPRALRNNARVPDQKTKLKQRLSLLLAAEHFEKIAAMAPALSRLNLLVDEDIRYALAFAYFNTGQFALSERHLAMITEPKLFEAALQLRRAIDTCQQAGWECQR